MQVQTVTVTLMGRVSELICHLINDFKATTASHPFIVMIETILQGGLEIKTRALIPDPDVNALLGHFHLNLNRGIRWQVLMGMANRIGEPFNQGQLALKQQLLGNGGVSKLIKPTEQPLQGRRVGASGNLTNLMVSQGSYISSITGSI